MSSKQFKHYDAICKVCKRMPIGTRWKCAECVDFDLCSSCHDQLGNHHGHRFWRIQSPQHLEKMIFKKSIKTKHLAMCNECRCFPIVGIRWKCMQCVDFDLCSECYHDGKHDNLGHPFLYTTSNIGGLMADENNFPHHGVECDNCSESPIICTRWKCAECVDFDLCSSCHDQLGNHHGHRFWRIQSPQHLEKMIFQKSIKTKHPASSCKACRRFPIVGIRWRCMYCIDFDLCSECYHDGKHDKLGHHFCCTISTTESSIADENGVRHQGVECDNCSESPIIGTRWKCSQCANFDLCTFCHNFGHNLHRFQHRFWRIESPQNLTPLIANNLQTERDLILSVSQMLKRQKLFKPESNPFGNVNIGYSASFAYDDDDYRNESPNNRDASQSNADYDRIESTNSNNRNASQTSTDTNLICVGSRVKIELDFDTVLFLQEASGCDLSGETLKDCMEHVGTVTQIKENGNVLVRYEHTGRQWTFNPVVLTRLADQSGPSENVVIRNLEKLSLGNDTLPSTESERNHITNIDENEHNRIVSAKNGEVAQYTAQLAKMQQELEKMKDEVTCPICMEARKNIIFQCGHGVCNECDVRLPNSLCPICRKRICQRIPFY